MNWKNVLLGLVVAVFFSALFLLNVFDRLEDQVYDVFLRFRADRELSKDIIFLDVDDQAVEYNGVFPWPRSITADGLLRLKEYGARAAIFDIEYIDKGPPGVDVVHLNQRLPGDFRESFSEINSMAGELSASLSGDRLNLADIDASYFDNLFQQFYSIANDQQTRLFSSAQAVARDNDEYMNQASALFGKSWVTLNLRLEEQGLLSGEQAGRRSMAEERFSRQVKASPEARRKDYVDILPPLPGFALSAKGAGFTNVYIDEDGTRRRIELAQNIHDHWYLQLAFAPLMDYLGNPELELTGRTMLIKGARMPGGEVKDITVPLDGSGRMLLDWPKTDYVESYTHISFFDISLLEDIESQLESYALAFGDMQIAFFDQFDPSLQRVPFIINELAGVAGLPGLFDNMRAAKARALSSSSDEDFDAFVGYRAQAHALIQELLDLDPGARVNALLPYLIESFPESAGGIREEAEYIESVTADLRTNLQAYNTTSGKLKNAVYDKFCILGRTDSGTTDYGATPFYGRYVNVGTHGVVLDMILSDSFINPLGTIWQALFTLAFVFLFFLASSKLAPVARVISGFLATALVITAAALLLRFAGVFVNPLLTVFVMGVAVILREIVSYAGSEREKEFIRKAFSTYVSDDIVKEIIADPSRLQLGGTKRHMSAIFTDVQGFSGISEYLDPEKLVSLLNRYLTFMSDAILEEKGTIDKYEGDAIIAFFGAPVDVPDHALRACYSAIKIKRIERTLNQKVTEEKLSPRPLLTRVGINTGSMVAGNMGTGNKMNYTIMGNAVNLAARLEGANKQYGTWILATDDTIRETGGALLTRRVDLVRVVGINEPVQLHEIINTQTDARPEEKKLVEIFHQALDYYGQRRWKEAAEGFRGALEIEKRGPSDKYIERCEAFIKYPPRDNWDGVTNLTEK